MPSQDRDVILISGIVATIRVIARSDENVGLYRTALDNRPYITKNINQQIYDTLGDGYFLYDLSIEEGSVHFVIMIATSVALILNGFSRYDAFLKSLDRLTDQIKRLVREFFSDNIPNRVTTRLAGGDAEPDVEAMWFPGQSVNAAAERFSGRPAAPPDLNWILLYYLIASHSVLIAVLIWIVVRLVH